MEKRKLLFIMPSMEGGGAERVLINLLNLLDYNLYTVDLIVLLGKGELWDSIPSKVNKRTSTYPSLFIRGIIYLFRTRKINLFWMLSPEIKGKYDVGISFMDSAYTELLFLNSLKLNKKIAVLHSSYKSYDNRAKFIKGSYKNILLARYAKLNNIIAVAHESKKEFVELFGTQFPVEVIYNPLNIKDIIEKSEEERPSELKVGTFNFVAVGSLLPVKDFGLLIRSASILKNNGYQFHLHILGEGVLREELSNLITELKLNDYVTLRGFIRNPYNWIKNADSFIMSSIVEGLPTVLCESLILGKPVIVPNVPGCREVIDFGKYGIMCERNENDFYEAMAKFITDPRLLETYAEKALERSKIFSDEIAIEKYNKLFQTI